MILHKHPSMPGRSEWYNRNFIGYWAPLPGFCAMKNNFQLPRPQDFVDESWDADERALIVQRLKSGTTFVYWMGYSYCRLCDESGMGTECFTADGSWIWPEGFAHYIEKHGVRPPQKFVDYLLGLPAGLVSVLEKYPKEREAIKARWEPHLYGEGCPDKGTKCEFKSDKPYASLCQKGNSGSCYCQWATDSATAEYEAARKRHQAALDPFRKHKWNPMG